jgi:hypothetical protein
MRIGERERGTRRMRRSKKSTIDDDGEIEISCFVCELGEKEERGTGGGKGKRRMQVS